MRSGVLEWLAMNKNTNTSEPAMAPRCSKIFPAVTPEKCLASILFVRHSDPECNGGTGGRDPEVVPWQLQYSFPSQA